MDEIRIDGLEIYAGHGVFEEENRTGQPFYVNAVLYTDIRPAGEADDLALSTHYGKVAAFINTFLKENTFRLIETAAERCAEQILLSFPRVQSLELEIKKPRAPIPLPFRYVSVKVTRGWKKAYLGIGSNQGDKQRYLDEAVEKLGRDAKIRRIRTSAWIVTKPYGGVEQEDFLNGAIELETLYAPDKLLLLLQEIEREAGRERLIHWGPRTLDLDILFYEDYLSAQPDLTVPHRDLTNREFVLRPLTELNPYLQHPLLGKSVEQLLRELEEREDPDSRLAEKRRTT